MYLAKLTVDCRVYALQFTRYRTGTRQKRQAVIEFGFVRGVDKIIGYDI